MSSVFIGLVAAIAVDGNNKAVYPEIINTDIRQTTAWWKVDLMRDVPATTVKIYLRTDYKYRRNGVQLYTSTTPFSIYPSGQLCYTFTGRSNGTDIPKVVSVNCTGAWRYLVVYTQTNNDGQGAVLDFGEVEVIGACSGGCQPGWRGTDCSMRCPTGLYGLNCEMLCSSRQCGAISETCDHVTGNCPGGCKSGWMGTDCMRVCSNGTYRANCQKVCADRHCRTPMSLCDHETGQCSPDGCQDSWIRIDCTNNPRTITVTAAVVIVLMIVVVGGTFFCLIRTGRLKWVKAAEESTEMDDFTNAQVIS